MKEKGPAPVMATQCADCKKRFGKDESRWDVHIGGGEYLTVCTPCFEKRDRRHPKTR
jgi:hypothetical protein